MQLKLNQMHMLTEALRSFVMRVAWEHDHKVHSANAGLCMNFSTDVIQEVTELNLDIHAGAGVDGCRAPTSWCATPSSGATSPATACSG